MHALCAQGNLSDVDHRRLCMMQQIIRKHEEYYKPYVIESGHHNILCTTSLYHLKKLSPILHAFAQYGSYSNTHRFDIDDEEYMSHRSCHVLCHYVKCDDLVAKKALIHYYSYDPRVICDLFIYAYKWQSEELKCVLYPYILKALKMFRSTYKGLNTFDHVCMSFFDTHLVTEHEVASYIKKVSRDAHTFLTYRSHTHTCKIDSILRFSDIVCNDHYCCYIHTKGIAVYNIQKRKYQNIDLTYNGIPLSLECIDISSTHNILAIGFSHGGIQLLNLDTRKKTSLYTHHKGKVYNVHFSSDEKHIFSTGSDGVVYKHGIHSLTSSVIHRADPSYTRVYPSPCGTYVACMTYRGYVYIYKVSDNTCIAWYEKGYYAHINWSSDERYYILQDSSGSIYKSSTDFSGSIKPIVVKGCTAQRGVVCDSQRFVLYTQPDHACKTCGKQSCNGHLRMYTLNDDQYTHSIELSQRISYITFSQTGRYVVLVASDKKSCDIYDTHKDILYKNVYESAYPANITMFAEYDSYFVVVDSRKRVHLIGCRTTMSDREYIKHTYDQY
jgi:hypothetical protein